MTPDEIKRQVDEFRRKALASFPLKLIETTGDKAFAIWQELKAQGKGTPVVLGADDELHDFSNLLTPFGPRDSRFGELQAVEEILRLAADIKYPDDLAKLKEANLEKALAILKNARAVQPHKPVPNMVQTKDGKTKSLTLDEVIAEFEREPRDPPLGVWPSETDASSGLSIAYDIRTDTPLPKVYIGIAPTDDWTTIPAYLRWGGWNDCPAPEYHVAAMRAWRDRYGAELVGISADTINLRVTRRPETRSDALSLAREQYNYCSDLIDQGVGTLSALAAERMANEWWYFWWD